MSNISFKRIKGSIKIKNSTKRIYRLELIKFPELPEYDGNPNDINYDIAKQNYDTLYKELIPHILNNTYYISVEEVNGQSFGNAISIPFIYEYYTPVSVYADLGANGPFYENFTLNLEVDTENLYITAVDILLSSQLPRNNTQNVFSTNMFSNT